MKTKKVKKAEGWEERFDDMFDGILFELPKWVTRVRGEKITMGDMVTFYEGKYIPFQHLKSFIKKEIKRATKFNT